MGNGPGTDEVDGQQQGKKGHQMIISCARCGWGYHEKLDCYCSGCGKQLKGLSVPEKDKAYMLYWGQGATKLIIPLINTGTEHSIQITEPWTLDGLNGVTALIDGKKNPKIDIDPGNYKDIEIVFNGTVMPPGGTKKGSVQIKAGIAPPVIINLLCSPLPRFSFQVNEILVRSGSVRVIQPVAESFSLDFRIDASRASKVNLQSFRLGLGEESEDSFPLPSDLKLPRVLKDGEPLEISVPVYPIFTKGNQSLSKLKAEVIFENCPPEIFEIEIVPGVRIDYVQNVSLINENAFIKGISPGRRVEINLYNSGGVQAELLDIRSLSNPWLTLQSGVTTRTLAPQRGNSSAFTLFVNPVCLVENEIPQHGQSGPDGALALQGRMLLRIKEIESGREFDQEIVIGAQVVVPRKLHFPLAIDFGNASSCVAYVSPAMEFKLAALEETIDQQEVFEFPSIIEFQKFCPLDLDETGEGFLYGDLLGQTRYAAGANIHHRVWHFKRYLGHHQSIARLDKANKRLRQFNADELSEFYFDEILDRFIGRTGFEVDRLVVTYPANFTKAQKEHLSKAAASHDEFEVIVEISEPEALALHYLRNATFSPGDYVFSVFDFGGGTTDITLGRFIVNSDDTKKLEILTSVGLDDMGGELLTFELAKTMYAKALQMGKNEQEPATYLFPEEFKQISSLSLSEKETLFNFMNFMKPAEELKINEGDRLRKLEKEGSLSIHIPEFYANRGAPDRCMFDFSFVDFNSVVRGYIEGGFQKLHRLFEQLKNSGAVKGHQSLDFIILGGNSCKLRYINEICRDIHKLSEHAIFFNPSEAKTSVALGAAYYGMLRDSPVVDFEFDNRPRLKYPIGVLLGNQLDILFHIGAEIETEVSREWRCSARLQVYQNLDPSEPSAIGNSYICLVGGLDLKAFGHSSSGVATFTIALKEDAILVMANGLEKSLKIDWY